MTDLMELASRVEAGEGPDTHLDAVISRAVGEDHILPLAYTASLDAAMSLVPEGYVGRIGYGPDGSGFNWAFCTLHAGWMAGDDLPRANGATPAIALTAAALRARARARARQGTAHVD